VQFCKSFHVSMLMNSITTETYKRTSRQSWLRLQKVRITLQRYVIIANIMRLPAVAYTSDDVVGLYGVMLKKSALS
jgi:hypothetical protein